MGQTYKKSNQTKQSSDLTALVVLVALALSPCFFFFSSALLIRVLLWSYVCWSRRQYTFLLVLKQPSKKQWATFSFLALQKVEAGPQALFEVPAARRWSVYVSCPRTGKGCTLGTVCWREIRPEISVLSTLSALPATFQSGQHHDWQQTSLRGAGWWAAWGSEGVR